MDRILSKTRSKIIAKLELICSLLKLFSCLGKTHSKTIPKLGETEGIGLEDKTIYQLWEEPKSGFYWLIAEQTDDIAFGFANLNYEPNAEWGDISISEIKEIGAKLITHWLPVKFSKAKLIANKRMELCKIQQKQNITNGGD